MINAKELRIGNTIYISWKNAVNKTIENVTISALLDLVSNGSGSAFYYEPIPITENILFDFGYRKEHDIYYKNESLLRFIGNEVFYCRGEIDDAEFQEYISSVKYVHELQNLHFALTQRELTVA